MLPCLSITLYVKHHSGACNAAHANTWMLQQRRQLVFQQYYKAHVYILDCKANGMFSSFRTATARALACGCHRNVVSTRADLVQDLLLVCSQLTRVNCCLGRLTIQSVTRSKPILGLDAVKMPICRRQTCMHLLWLPPCLNADDDDDGETSFLCAKGRNKKCVFLSQADV